MVKNNRIKRFAMAFLIIGLFVGVTISNQLVKADLCPVEKRLPGRMTGGGVLIGNGGVEVRVTHGFELYCSPELNPQNLEINFGGNHFHLENVTESYCFDNPNLNQHPPAAPIDTLVLLGTGRYNNVDGARIGIIFTDGGEPGTLDTGTILLIDPNGNTVLDFTSNLTGGNHQAHRLQQSKQ